MIEESTSSGLLYRTDYCFGTSVEALTFLAQESTAHGPGESTNGLIGSTVQYPAKTLYKLLISN